MGKKYSSPFLIGLENYVFLLILFIAVIDCGDGAPIDESTELQQITDGCYYNYNHYNEGDRILTNEPCLNCTCHDKMLMCYLRVCPFTKPIGQDCVIEKREDQCCPIITCPEVPVNVMEHKGQGATTDLGFLEKYGCNIDGNFFPEGAQVPSNPNKPCELCYCINNRTSCIMQECTLHIDGCQPIYHRGSCCPVRYNCDHEEELTEDLSTTTIKPTEGFILTTSSDITKECVHHGQVYFDGASIESDKKCEHCYCMKGDIVCAVQECIMPLEFENRNCTSVKTNKNDCCPESYSCLDEMDVVSKPEITTKSTDLEETTLTHPEISEEDLQLQEHINDLGELPLDKHVPLSKVDETTSPIGATEEPVTQAIFEQTSTEQGMIFDIKDMIPLSIPGEGSCLVEDRTYKNNSFVPSYDKCEYDCICISSVVKCESIICEKPSTVNCKINESTRDLCCPTYDCEEEKIEKMVPDFTTYSPDKESGTQLPPEQEMEKGTLQPESHVKSEPTEQPIEERTPIPSEKIQPTGYSIYKKPAIESDFLTSRPPLMLHTTITPEHGLPLDQTDSELLTRGDFTEKYNTESSDEVKPQTPSEETTDEPKIEKETLKPALQEKEIKLITTSTEKTDLTSKTDITNIDLTQKPELSMEPDKKLPEFSTEAVGTSTIGPDVDVTKPVLPSEEKKESPQTEKPLETITHEAETSSEGLITTPMQQTITEETPKGETMIKTETEKPEISTEETEFKEPSEMKKPEIQTEHSTIKEDLPSETGTKLPSEQYTEKPESIIKTNTDITQSPEDKSSEKPEKSDDLKPTQEDKPVENVEVGEQTTQSEEATTEQAEKGEKSTESGIQKSKTPEQEILEIKTEKSQEIATTEQAEVEEKSTESGVQISKIPEEQMSESKTEKSQEMATTEQAEEGAKPTESGAQKSKTPEEEISETKTEKSKLPAEPFTESESEGEKGTEKPTTEKISIDQTEIPIEDHKPELETRKPDTGVSDDDETTKKVLLHEEVTEAPTTERVKVPSQNKTETTDVIEEDTEKGIESEKPTESTKLDTSKDETSEKSSDDETSKKVLLPEEVTEAPTTEEAKVPSQNKTETTGVTEEDIEKDIESEKPTESTKLDTSEDETSEKPSDDETSKKVLLPQEVTEAPTTEEAKVPSQNKTETIGVTEEDTEKDIESEKQTESTKLDTSKDETSEKPTDDEASKKVLLPEEVTEAPTTEEATVPSQNKTEITGATEQDTEKDIESEKPTESTKLDTSKDETSEKPGKQETDLETDLTNQGPSTEFPVTESEPTKEEQAKTPDESSKPKVEVTTQIINETEIDKVKDENIEIPSSEIPPSSESEESELSKKGLTEEPLTSVITQAPEQQTPVKMDVNITGLPTEDQHEKSQKEDNVGQTDKPGQRQDYDVSTELGEKPQSESLGRKELETPKPIIKEEEEASSDEITEKPVKELATESELTLQGQTEEPKESITETHSKKPDSSIEEEKDIERTTEVKKEKDADEEKTLKPYTEKPDKMDESTKKPEEKDIEIKKVQQPGDDKKEFEAGTEKAVTMGEEKKPEVQQQTEEPEKKSSTEKTSFEYQTEISTETTESTEGLYSTASAEEVKLTYGAEESQKPTKDKDQELEIKIPTESEEITEKPLTEDKTEQAEPASKKPTESPEIEEPIHTTMKKADLPIEPEQQTSIPSINLEDQKNTTEDATNMTTVLSTDKQTEPPEHDKKDILKTEINDLTTDIPDMEVSDDTEKQQLSTEKATDVDKEKPEDNTEREEHTQIYEEETSQKIVTDKPKLSGEEYPQTTEIELPIQNYTQQPITAITEPIPLYNGTVEDKLGGEKQKGDEYKPTLSEEEITEKPEELIPSDSEKLKTTTQASEEDISQTENNVEMITEILRDDTPSESITKNPVLPIEELTDIPKGIEEIEEKTEKSESITDEVTVKTDEHDEITEKSEEHEGVTEKSEEQIPKLPSVILEQSENVSTSEKPISSLTQEPVELETKEPDSVSGGSTLVPENETKSTTEKSGEKPSAKPELESSTTKPELVEQAEITEPKVSEPHTTEKPKIEVISTEEKTEKPDDLSERGDFTDQPEQEGLPGHKPAITTQKSEPQSEKSTDIETSSAPSKYHITEQGTEIYSEDVTTPLFDEKISAASVKPLEATTPTKDIFVKEEISTEKSVTRDSLSTQKEDDSTTSKTSYGTRPTEIPPLPYQPPGFPSQYPSYTDDYSEEEEPEIFGPGTCRYGGKLFVSAQQIPRDDPCDFCFCFRSDIICLQQSCPPPISGCNEEPIQGFCCPRYECPVSMATSFNSTTTTTTLPPHFLHRRHPNIVERNGCLIQGQPFKVGDRIPSASGPCMQCKCGGDGQMKCDPKPCTPEPMLRQMIAAVASRRR